MLAVLPATLAKLVVILKLGLRNIKKDNNSHIFKNLHPSQYALTGIILFLLK